MTKEADCLPCPCCGGHAKIHPGKQYRITIQDWHNEEDALYQPCEVKCCYCGLKIIAEACNADCLGANGAAKEARRKVVALWNRRTAP